MGGIISPPNDQVCNHKNISKESSKIFQGDGDDTISSNNTVVSQGSIEDENDTTFDTDEEVDPESEPVILNPVHNQHVIPGQPIAMDVMTKSKHDSILPLCIMLNARSVNNKADHFKDLYQLGPDLILTSETWE